MNQIATAVPGVAISTGFTMLMESIKTYKRFKPTLNHLEDTVRWITPRVVEMRRFTDSHEIQKLMDLLNQAKAKVDESSRVSSWNIRKKYKFTKELIDLDDSIRTTLNVFFPVMIYDQTTQIQTSVDELKHIFDLIRDRLVNSQPAEVVNDIVLWKRKKISGSLLVGSTATWVLHLQQVYEYNFPTVASWIAILSLTSLFIWRHVNWFLDREEASKSRLDKLRHQFAKEISNACWEVTDTVIRWIYEVTDVEAKWSVFPQTISYLLLFAYVGSFFHLPTLCGVVMTGTTVPVMLANHGDRIKPVGSMVGKVVEVLVENLTNTMNNNGGKEEIKKSKIKKQL